MIFQRTLSAIAGTKAKARVLEELGKYPTVWWSGTGLAKHCGISAPQAIEALNELGSHGVVTSMAAGRATMWKLNEKHLLAAAISDFSRPDRMLSKLIIEQTGNHVRKGLITKATLFGSVAKGQERKDSDLDLYVEIKSEKDRKEVLDGLSDTCSFIAQATGNVLIPMIVTVKEAKAKKNTPLFMEIQKDGIILLPQQAKCDEGNPDEKSGEAQAQNISFKSGIILSRDATRRV